MPSNINVQVLNPPAITVEETDTEIIVVVGNPTNVTIDVSPVDGQKGDKGDKGDPGSSISKVHKHAGTILSSNRIVFVDTDEKVYYADKDTPGHINKILGMTLSSVIQDEAVDVLTFGDQQDPSFTFDMTKPVYLGNNGLMTQTYPATGFALPIGFPIAVDTIMIELKTPIVL